jgi:hypothetical protein
MIYVSLLHFPATSSQGINIYLAFRYLFLDQIDYGDYLRFCFIRSILCKFLPNKLISPARPEAGVLHLI